MRHGMTGTGDTKAAVVRDIGRDGAVVVSAVPCIGGGVVGCRPSGNSAALSPSRRISPPLTDAMAGASGPGTPSRT